MGQENSTYSQYIPALGGHQRKMGDHKIKAGSGKRLKNQKKKFKKVQRKERKRGLLFIFIIVCL